MVLLLLRTKFNQLALTLLDYLKSIAISKEEEEYLAFSPETDIYSTLVEDTEIYSLLESSTIFVTDFSRKTTENSDISISY
jgi:hypothetical protein